MKRALNGEKGANKFGESLLQRFNFVIFVQNLAKISTYLFRRNGFWIKSALENGLCQLVVNDVRENYCTALFSVFAFTDSHRRYVAEKEGCVRLR